MIIKINEKEYNINPYANLREANLREADLEGANLRWANLREADLQGANLRWANLREANLYGANLREANLEGANLRWANLEGAYLYGAYLYGANLQGANLEGADLIRANLQGANLRGADLIRADLQGANLQGTCLDPTNKPNGLVEEFEREGEYIYGYRTQNSPVVNSEFQYEVGKSYTAPIFSTSDTDCHPGLYLYPDIELVRNHYSNCRVIKVKALAQEVHKAGNKWRCKSFEEVNKIS